MVLRTTARLPGDVLDTSYALMRRCWSMSADSDQHALDKLFRNTILRDPRSVAVLMSLRPVCRTLHMLHAATGNTDIDLTKDLLEAMQSAGMVAQRDELGKDEWYLDREGVS